MPARLPTAFAVAIVSSPFLVPAPAPAAARTPAAAAGPLAISTRMLVEKRVAAADGTVAIRLVAPAKVVPGDRVTVVLTYRNTGARPIADLVLANPVPQGMVFRAAGPAVAPPEYSVDGHSFASLAALRMPPAADGAVGRTATAADVTRLRWRLAAPVAPGTGGELTFQAVLK